MSEVSLDFAFGLQDKLDLRRGRLLHAKNIITDEGLEILKRYSLDEILEYCAIGQNVVDGSASDTALDEVSAVTGSICDMPSTLWQDSYLEGWSNTPGAADVLTHAGDWTWIEVLKSRVLVAASFDILTQEAGPFAGGFFHGGQTTNLRELLFARAIENRLQAVDCDFPPDGFEETTYKYHILTDMWNRALFKEAGAPIAIDLDFGVANFEVFYTIRLLVPTVEVVQVINVNGVDTTCRTRAYRADSATRWNPNNFGVWNTQLGDFKAWESNTMPALNADIAGSNASPTVVTKADGPAGQHWVEIEHTWGGAVANFATGIGAVTHFAPDGINDALITTFTPKLAGKTTSKKFVFKARYAWERVSGD